MIKYIRELELKGWTFDLDGCYAKSTNRYVEWDWDERDTSLEAVYIDIYTWTENGKENSWLSLQEYELFYKFFESLKQMRKDLKKIKKCLTNNKFPCIMVNRKTKR